MRRNTINSQEDLFQLCFPTMRSKSYLAIFFFIHKWIRQKKKNRKEKRSCFFLTLILCRDVFMIYSYWLSRSIYLGTHNIFLEMAILICVFGIEWWKIRFSLILFSITRLICRGVRTSMFTFLNHLARTCLEKNDWLSFAEGITLMPALDKIYLDISSLKQTWNDMNHQLKKWHW